MSELNVSPGEWRVVKMKGLSPNDFFVATDPYEGHPYFGHCKTVELMSDERYPLKRGDAHLMAASKDLYAACEKLLPKWSSDAEIAPPWRYPDEAPFCEITHSDVRRILEAMRKARGDKNE